ncbi:hypothetical protein T4A_2616 [Trichinella pseudospiralis]|uniref:Uncharacterized protein n=1 Tax=Trichinella pseudospiralis TaxID=6337 RepID=A0A0V1E5H4_TRIPS|nr:hypothetical protein T4A_2616 [Trichinella pseudospiralis]
MSVDLMTVALFHRQEQNREVGFDRSRLLLLACSRTPGVKMQAESAPHRSQLNVWSSGGTNSASVTSDNTTPASDRPHAKRAANRHLRE